jgi:hypothetical protein
MKRKNNQSGSSNQPNFKRPRTNNPQPSRGASSTQGTAPVRGAPSNTFGSGPAQSSAPTQGTSSSASAPGTAPSQPDRSQNIDPGIQSKTPSNIDWNGSYDLDNNGSHVPVTSEEQAADLQRAQTGLKGAQQSYGNHITNAVIE